MVGAPDLPSCGAFMIWCHVIVCGLIVFMVVTLPSCCITIWCGGSCMCPCCPRCVVWPIVPPRNGNFGAPHRVLGFPYHFFQETRCIHLWFHRCTKSMHGALYSMYNCHLCVFLLLMSYLFSRASSRAPMNTFDLNCDAKHLTFIVNGNNMYAKHRNEEMGRMEPISREAFATTVEECCRCPWPLWTFCVECS